MAKYINTKQLPQAGEHKKSTLNEYWSLAPLPIPTGYPAIPQFIKPNRATLDYGNDDCWGFEFSIRLTFWLCFLAFMIVFTVHMLGIYAEMYKGLTFFAAIIKSTCAVWPVYLLFVGGGGAFLSFLVYINFRKHQQQVPIRFHHEKREVACQMDDGQVIIADWEAVHVQIEQSLMVTQYYASNQCTLTLTLTDKHSDNVAKLDLGYPIGDLAIAEWEAIRVFMEQGQSVLDKQTKTPEQLDAVKAINAPKGTSRYYEQQLNKYPEGSPAYFYALKAQKQYEKRGYYWWCFLHILSGWTLPCKIAGWLTDHPRVERSRSFNQWSQSIPKTQWAQPSEALKTQTIQLEQAYRQGNTFKHYFTKPTPENT